MVNFTSGEQFDMLECYLRNNRNSSLARARYLEDYPDRQQPNRRYFSKIVYNLINFGSFNKPRSKRYRKNNEARDNNIIQHFNNHPSSSSRIASRELGLPKATISRVLKEHKYHPYKPTIVQGLNEHDYPRRLAFCNWFLQKCRENRQFTQNVVWTDETYFSNCGIFNRRNTHHWALENPEIRAGRRLQTRFGFNVWCGIYGR